MILEANRIDEYAGRKVVLERDTYVLCGYSLPAGATGYVITGPMVEDDHMLYVAFDQLPGDWDEPQGFNWFIDLDDADLVEAPETDGLPVVRLKGQITDDDGLILMDGSVGFVIDEDTGEEVLSVAFPNQDYRRNAGRSIGADGLIVHYLNRADLEFV